MRQSDFKKELSLLFSFSRLGRIRYLCFSVLITAFCFIFFLAAAILDVTLAKGRLHILYPLVFGTSFIFLFALFLIAFVYHIILDIRRLHDMNLRGWWLLIGLVPFAGPVLLILLYFIPGNWDANRFGKTPPKNTSWTYTLLGGSLMIMIVFIIAMATMTAIYVKPEMMVHAKHLQHQLKNRPTAIHHKFKKYRHPLKIIQ